MNRMNNDIGDIEKLVISTDYLQYRSFMNEYSDDFMEKYFNTLSFNLPNIKNKRNFNSCVAKIEKDMGIGKD